MGRNSYLQILRKQNNGYNPEPLENFDHLKVERESNGLLLLKNVDTNESEAWTKTSCSCEEEFIERWPRVFGIVYRGRFYYRAN